ncbi:MAG: UbiD family decarboxylase [Phycisphaerales bacterium]
MYPTTRDFIQALDRAGELKRIAAPVSPVLEITEIADRHSKSPAPGLPAPATRSTDPRFHHLGGSALLFESVEGSDIPVLINQFGSYRRVEMALGCERGLEALAERIGTLIKPEPPPTLIAKLKKLPELLELARIPPKRVRSGICQEVVLTGDRVDLTRLPIIRCWPHDGDFAALGYPAGLNDHIPELGRGPEWERWGGRGRYITLAGIHTIHADERDHPSPPSRNIGMYRVQLFGKRHMAMHWHMHHDGARHWRSWKKRGERMPVAIALGGESVLPYAATAPMPPGISELLLAGFLNKGHGGIPLVRGKTVPIDVPANSEIVIEGYVSAESGPIGWDPRHSGTPLGPGAVFEGPFGDHTGFYSLPDRYPLLEVTAITHRKDPIYPTTVVGLPPQEDYFLGKATERLFLPLLRTIIPDIIDYDLPMFGAFHNCAFLKIRKEYPLQARRIMHAVWGAGQMAWTKTIVVVDEDVDVHDTCAVMRAVGERCEHINDRDLARVDGPLDILDHAAPELGAGGKIGFDATRKWPAERLAGPPVIPQDGDASARHPRPDHPAAADRLLRSLREHRFVRAAAIPQELGSQWAFVSLKTEAINDPASIDQAAALLAESDGVRYALLLGPDVDPDRTDDALFHWCANSDPRRDLIARAPMQRTLVFDATPKSRRSTRNGLPARDWPPILKMSPEVVARISARSGEFGLA